MRVGSLPPVSNQATWQTERQVIDTETDEAIDLTGASIIFEIREKGSATASLSATTANGKIVIVDDTTYQITFPDTDMQTLCAGTYDVGLTIEQEDVVTQIIIGTLPVVERA